MNIVYFIGNGFDLKQGLDTRCARFCAHYKTVQDDREPIQKLKNALHEETALWSDFERQLGEFAASLTSLEEFDIAYFDLVDRLSEFLLAEQENFDTETCDPDKLFANLVAPEAFLTTTDQASLQKKFKSIRSSAVNVRLVTFNYTDTLERIIGEPVNNLVIGERGNRRVYLQSLEHIHQYIGETMVVGVNDATQIASEQLARLQEVQEALIKPANNSVQGHGRDEVCANYIAKANLIVMYGVSMGETDRLWWERIAERIGNSCCLILFDRGEAVAGQHISRKARYKRKLVENFFSASGLGSEEIEQKLESVFVALTDEYFNLEKSSEEAQPEPADEASNDSHNSNIDTFGKARASR